MKKLLLMMLLPLAMSIVSCEKNEDPIVGGGGSETPDVSVTSSAEVQSYHSVVLKGYANGADGKVGFCYSATNENPTPDNSECVETSSVQADNSYELIVDNLQPNTKYYYRAFATKGLKKELAKEVKTFLTNDYRLVLIDAEDITCNSVVLKGQAEDKEFEVGFCISNTVYVPTLENAVVYSAELQSDNSFSVAVSDLKQATAYYYRAYARKGDIILLSDIKKIITEKRVVDANGHEYVDLGLESGLLWATCNVGASKPEQYGDYFAWGETEGYMSGKTSFSWSTYKYCNNDDGTGLTKYTIPDGQSGIWYNDGSFVGDNKTVLEAGDDAATANWGGAWRMPTEEELNELRKNCTWTLTTLNGVDGYNVEGPNGKSIFLPAAGYIFGELLYQEASISYYWSSSLNTSNSNFARGLTFATASYNCDYGNRCYGRSVRPVCE